MSLIPLKGRISLSISCTRFTFIKVVKWSCIKLYLMAREALDEAIPELEYLIA
ncbi:hypothetical protein LguiB_019732 [Lonicera macranthoides]